MINIIYDTFRCFTRSSDMLKHLRGHRGEKPFICPDCDKAFARKSHLTSHYETQHKNVKSSHKCSLCDKSFHRSQQLEVHMRSHSGEKPFICSVCDKGFTRNSTLKVRSVYEYLVLD